MGVSAREMGRRLGVTHVAVLKAHKGGRISRNEDGTFDPDTVAREWRKNTDLRNGRNAITGHPKGTLNGAGEETDSLTKSRTVFEAFRAALARLEYQRRSGALISADEVKRTAFNEFRRCREHLMAIPDRIAPVLVGMTDAEEIHKMLTEEITNALSELSGSKEEPS